MGVFKTKDGGGEVLTGPEIAKLFELARTTNPTACTVRGCDVVSKGHDGYLQHYREAHDKK